MTGMERLTRRSALGAIGAGAAIVAAGRLVPASGAHAIARLQGDSIASGALGLSRADFIDLFGEGQLVEEGAGYNLYEYFTDPGLMYVAFTNYTDLEVTSYVEIQLDSDGLAHDAAEQLVLTLIPADARIGETFLAPSTPSGPTAIRTARYASESLGTVFPSVTSFLSTRMQTWSEEDGWTVKSIHLVVAEIGQ